MSIHRFRSVIRVFVLVLLPTAFSASPALAAIPTQLNHQGLIQYHGVAVDGTALFQFALVDAHTGLNVWTNDGTELATAAAPWSAVELPVYQGVYSINLGDAAGNGTTPILSDLFAGNGLVLRVWCDVLDGSGPQPLAPDIALTSSPYAHRAAKADQAAMADNATTADQAATASTALDAQTLGGQSPADFHNAALLTGTVPSSALNLTDSDIPDTITVAAANSAITAVTASVALSLVGFDPADFATVADLLTGLAGKSDTGHLHNLQDLPGAVTDAQVPDDITIQSATSAITAVTASVALALEGFAPGDYATQSDLTTGLAGKSDDGHDHDADYYTQAQLDTALAGKSDDSHLHNLQDLPGAVTDAQVPDDITIQSATSAITAVTASVALALEGFTPGNYATQSDLTTGLAGKSDTGHDHDADYYTQAQLDTALAGKSDDSHLHNLQDLPGAVTDAQVPDDITIQSATSAITAVTANVALALEGFTPGDYATQSDLTTGLAGKSDTGHDHDADYYTQAQLDTALAGKSNAGHLHNLQDLPGAVTDAQVPDDITITETDTLHTVAGRGASTSHGIAVATVDTGQGANELYAMDQNVRTSDSVDFAGATLSPSAVLDQDNFPALFYFGLPSGGWGAQTFTPGLTGNLTRVKLTVGHQGTPGDIHVSVYAGATPGSGSLISSVETVTVTTHYDSPLAYEVDLASPAPVEAAQPFYILIEPQAENVSVGGQTTSTYPGGNLWSGGSSHVNFDYAFQTWVAAGGDVLDLHGVARIRDSANPPADATDRLYNNSGNLFWNGTQLDAPVSVDKDGLLNAGTLAFLWADGEVADNLTVSGGTVNNTVIGGTLPAAGTFTTLAADTLNTGQGAYELYAMNQNVRTTDSVTFSALASGNASITGQLGVSGVVEIQNTVNPPAPTSNRLYNNGGNLFWNGTQLGGGGGSATAVDTITVTLDYLSTGWNGFPVWAQKMKHSGTLLNFQIYAETANGGKFDLLKNGVSVLSVKPTFATDTVVEAVISNSTFASGDVYKIVFSDSTGDHYPAIGTLIVQYD